MHAASCNEVKQNKCTESKQQKKRPNKQARPAARERVELSIFKKRFFFFFNTTVYYYCRVDGLTNYHQQRIHHAKKISKLPSQ